ncbi:outer membrane lipoprotein carrier protein LolA [Shewanella yunxiaonensis]|uniref:Outer membrane lipoprotein carrier protein LolA n=1 Tax=Shewanella yunxiaonensis TaxID=2829809 RepID=A0ABX7YSI4_9GAMM|nr:LolA-related protein [Shewanella yunxiaonensis]QUN05717.1 outer membrane lipoprotein carrier protein LolA [Shewanella yunxiaonensis]
MRYLFGILLLLLCHPVMADNRPQPGDYDRLFATEASSEQLQQLQQRLALGDSSRGSFQQTRWLRVLKQPLYSSGRFIFAPNEGMLWQQQQPFATTLILKQQQLLQIDSQGQLSVQQTSDAPTALASLLPKLMQALLAGNIEYLQQHFALYLQQQSSWQLGLIAKDSQLKTVLPRLILSGEAQPQQLLMLGRHGDLSDIRFSQIHTGPLSSAEQLLFIPSGTAN